MAGAAPAPAVGSEAPRRPHRPIHAPRHRARLTFGFKFCRPDQTGKARKDVTNVKTYFPNELNHDWVVIDAAGQRVGRLATQIATVLKGKHKPSYTPNQPGGDFVIVINADKVEFTGRKLDQKVYRRYTGYQGGLKENTAREMLEKHPVRVLEHAVWGMLPKTRMGRRLIRRLKVYAGEAHPHHAQQPKKLELA